jgi:hypothetical protein
MGDGNRKLFTHRIETAPDSDLRPLKSETGLNQP